MASKVLRTMAVVQQELRARCKTVSVAHNLYRQSGTTSLHGISYVDQIWGQVASVFLGVPHIKRGSRQSESLRTGIQLSEEIHRLIRG